MKNKEDSSNNEVGKDILGHRGQSRYLVISGLLSSDVYWYC